MTKRVYKIEDGAKLCGVCGGIAEYFNIDPTIVRVIWGVAVLCGGFGFWLYVICAFVFPKKSDVIPEPRYQYYTNPENNDKEA